MSRRHMQKHTQAGETGFAEFKRPVDGRKAIESREGWA